MSMETKPLLPTPPHRKFAVPLLASLLLLSSLFISTSFLSRHSPRLFPFFRWISPADSDTNLFVETKLRIRSPPSASAVPRLAYLVSGSSGEGPSLLRVLRALYHPSNSYVLHLDLEAPPSERLELSAAVQSDPVYSRFGNVRVVVRANMVTYRGPTMVANTLHAAAILLKEAGNWDWFINLSASDYPLVTQDDLLYTLSTIPRHLNFLEHTSDIGWKENQRAKPVIVDPGLYSLQKSDVFWVSEKRSLPTAFKLFTGSAWMMLSRQFIEFCVWGWDNLPRTVLMYYANFLSSPEGYFHTVICNAPEFRNTTVNHDLHFIAWDNPPKQHPHFLTLRDFSAMVKSNTPFARKFGRDDPVLDKIDKHLLGREADGFVPSAWQGELKMERSTTNYSVKDVSELKPGLGARRLNHLIKGLLSADGFDDKHCI